MREPLLASREVSGDEYGRKVRGWLGVFGGLHMMRGNPSPHFTITTEVHQKGYPDRWWSGGADHETILKHFPRFADLVALHLSDIDGVPMHAAANGWYWYADYDGKGTSLYPHQEPMYSMTPHERAAHYLRLKPEELPEGLDKETFAAFVETLRPRWKAEADAAREKYHLAVFGDPWPA